MREVTCPVCGAFFAHREAVIPAGALHCLRCGEDFVLRAEGLPSEADSLGSSDPGLTTELPPVSAPPDSVAAPVASPVSVTDASPVQMDLWKTIATEAHPDFVWPAFVFTAVSLLLVVPVWVACESVIPFGGVLLVGWLGILFHAGLVRASLSHLTGLQFRFRDFLGGLRSPYFERALVAQALVGGATLVPVAPGLAILRLTSVWNGCNLFFGVALLTLGLPLSFWVYVRLGLFTAHFLLDRGCRPLEAIQGNWRLTRGYFGPVSEYFVCFLPAFAFHVPVLSIFLAPLMPYVALVTSTGYLLGVGSPLRFRVDLQRWRPAGLAESGQIQATTGKPAGAITTGSGDAGEEQSQAKNTSA